MSSFQCETFKVPLSNAILKSIEKAQKRRENADRAQREEEKRRQQEREFVPPAPVQPVYEVRSISHNIWDV